MGIRWITSLEYTDFNICKMNKFAFYPEIFDRFALCNLYSGRAYVGAQQLALAVYIVWQWIKTPVNSCSGQLF